MKRLKVLPFLAIPTAALVWGLSAQSTPAQTAVEQLNATYITGTGGTSGNYTIKEVNGTRVLNHNFNDGLDNNLKVNSFTLLNSDFQFVRLVSQIKLNRVDTVDQNGVPIVGSREIVFYERGPNFSLNQNNLNVKPTAVKTMEEALLSDLINRGTDNIFGNQGNVAGNNNNIERVDFIEPKGLSAPGANLKDIGFLILERGGNDNFKIAAITELDAGGKPSKFGKLITVNVSQMGKTNQSVITEVMRKDPGDANLRYTTSIGTLQPIGAAFFSFDALGITGNQTFYGYALFPPDVTTSNDLVGLSNFPKDTPSDSTGGMDLMAGGGIFALGSVQFTDLAISKTDGQTQTKPGSPITYTITVKNNGPVPVTSLTVTDGLPASIQNTQYTPSTGVYDKNTGNWTGVNLASGQSITLTVSGTVSPDATGTITNTARVFPPTGFVDSDNSNNSSTDTTAIATATISGTLYQDSNANNSFDNGTDPRLGANITVKLYNDANNNNIIDPGEEVDSKVTDANGNYTFTSVTNGSYKIQVDTTDSDIPAGFTLTTPNHLAVTVSGSSVTGQNFGFVKFIANANVVLVKRITAVNTTTFSDLIDGVNDSSSPNYVPPPHDANDNNPNWLPGYLLGRINGGAVRPGDEIEYTIYFLSTGNATAPKVLLCDRVPENTNFLPTAFNSGTGADRGIALYQNGTTVSLTNVSDGDAGQYFPPGADPTTVYPKISCGGPNTNGAIVVNLGDLPNATGSGTPASSFGHIRFRGQVK
ncbi:hypothetical protein NUACC21_75510 [Scytonema sp. NUACC21]